MFFFEIAPMEVPKIQAESRVSHDFLPHSLSTVDTWPE
jgi:hypothetical protein